MGETQSFQPRQKNMVAKDQLDFQGKCYHGKLVGGFNPFEKC